MIFTFENCQLDTDRFELRRDGAPVHLEPQVFDVLAHLVANHDRVINRFELLDEVWGDRFVSESAVSSRIKAARRAIGDDGTEQRLIKTLHGRGYRFVADVAVAASPTGDGPPVDAALPDLLERAEALSALGDALDDADSGTGRVVLLGGEPGIGKTAVARRFVDGVADRATVLWGGCDDLITPRPFAPIHDLAHLDEELDAALVARESPLVVQRCLLTVLGRGPAASVLVIEDVHWADEATLDLLTFVGRRIGHTRALLVLTYRDTELGDDHPLVSVLGSMPADLTRQIDLRPLSLPAVATLAGEHRAEQVMAVSNGNPFFVTELAAAEGTAVPSSVRHATVARVARQPEATRELLGLVAVAPARLEIEVLDAVRPDWSRSIEPAERGGIVVVERDHVRFRHELARRSVLDALPAATRHRLHVELLSDLVGRTADPALIVHHAEAAGDDVRVATYAVRAARQAAAVSAHREALSQFRRALRVADGFTAAERAVIHEEASHEAYLVADESSALDLARSALAEFEQLGDVLGAGRLHRWLSRIYWISSRRTEADAEADEAIAVLEALQESTELAWAYSNRSQLDMLAYRDDAATMWGNRAVELAERLGDDEVRAHALVNVGLVEIGRDPDDDATVLEAVELAIRAGEHHEATRGLLGLSFALMFTNRLDRAREVGQQALDHAHRHEIDALVHYVEAMLGRIDILAGRWDATEERLRDVVAEGPPVSQLLALTGLALLHVRRGDGDAKADLAQVWELAESADELQRLAPVAAVDAERAWLAGELTGDSRHLRSCYSQLAERQPTIAGELARWLDAAGEPVVAPDQIDEPYRLELARDWTRAAELWDSRHMPYDRALCLARSGNRANMDVALTIAEELGAAPLAAWIRSRTAR